MGEEFNLASDMLEAVDDEAAKSTRWKLEIIVNNCIFRVAKLSQLANYSWILYRTQGNPKVLVHVR